jgi:glycine cleavage system H protein
MEIDKKCRYTESHEWARLEGDEVVIGISDFAQGELGDVVYVELPGVDDQLAAGEECGMIDSAKTTSPLMNPVSGVVTRINDELADHPELVNHSPYDEGWMYAVKPDVPAEYEGLMGAEEYTEFVKQASH